MRERSRRRGGRIAAIPLRNTRGISTKKKRAKATSRFGKKRKYCKGRGISAITVEKQRWRATEKGGNKG